MSAIEVTCRRTLSLARSLHSTAIAIAGFCAIVSIVFMLGLESLTGGGSLVSIWALSISRAVPFLAAVLAMDVWSGDLRSGRLELLLSTSVKERDFTIGKFLGVCVLLLIAILLSFLICSVTLLWGIPRPSMGEILGAIVIVLAQGITWCAVSVLTSSIFRNGAIAALFSLVFTCGLPRGIWSALISWAPQERLGFGVMPFDAQAIDFAASSISVGVIVGYIIVSLVALFISSKAIAFRRLAGYGSRKLRFSTVLAMVLSIVAGVLAALLSLKLCPDFTLLTSPIHKELALRTRDILNESSGAFSITSFMSRNLREFAETSRILRSLERTSKQSGAQLSLQFVDPKWDIGASERLVRLGYPENCVIVENVRRKVVLKVADGIDERRIASALKRVALPIGRRNIYWTIGHGEFAFDNYDNWGMSEVARELEYDGYHNCQLDLTTQEDVADDCAAVVIAGMKEDFSRVELDRIESYLRRGGRLLVMLARPFSDGIATLLSTWGIRPVSVSFNNAVTISGSDVIISEFTGHEISDRFVRSRIVLNRPLAFLPSASISAANGIDRIIFSPIALVGSSAVVVATERGGAVGGDLAIRPTRIVAIGDASSFVNSQLKSRGHANRDFFLNCISHLSGGDTFGSAELCDAEYAFVGLDRAAKRRLVLATCIVSPLFIYLLLTAIVLRRRHRR